MFFNKGHGVKQGGKKSGGGLKKKQKPEAILKYRRVANRILNKHSSSFDCIRFFFHSANEFLGFWAPFHLKRKQIFFLFFPFFFFKPTAVLQFRPSPVRGL